MTLDWNQIKTRAVQFSADFENTRHERQEAQTFWNRFFEIFGIERRRVAVFESKVKKLNNHTGFIDLLWPGLLLVEHKSQGDAAPNRSQKGESPRRRQKIPEPRPRIAAPRRRSAFARLGRFGRFFNGGMAAALRTRTGAKLITVTVRPRHARPPRPWLIAR